ncbi:hypothetical protein HII12_004758 [Brettanomyces bruxellensis]|uniref:Coatomer subunit epsilon n=1 Tax=Dekkera bruxellensis TaxID=5007 RepID=A0A8H6EQP9_DEKBR|nr:hypothetical protein HII12_004758 [Brettanomyces bruxellensis]
MRFHDAELYTVLQLYHCARYGELAKLDLEQELDFSDQTYKFEAYNYQTRANLLLGKYKEALAKIEESKKIIPSFTEQSEASFLQSELEALIKWIVFSSLKLLLCQKGDLEAAFKRLHPKEDLENVEFGCYLLLLLSKTTDAQRFLDDHVTNDSASDTVGYNQTEAWIQLEGYGDELNRAYYHFDDLAGSGNTTSLKLLVCVLVSHLKLHHMPEAEETLSRIVSYRADHRDEEAAELGNWAVDLLVDEIALRRIQSRNSDADALFNKLKAEHPDSAYVKDVQAKQDAFDDIVAKYAA